MKSAINSIRHYLESIKTAMLHPYLGWNRATQAIDLRIASRLLGLQKAGYLAGITKVYDVGANIGVFARACSLVLKDAEVICFEPIPSSFVRLKKNVETRRNIRVEMLAVGECSKVATMHTSEMNQADSLLQPAVHLLEGWTASKPSGETKVEVVTLDEFALGSSKAERIFLKIDVQGYELNGSSLISVE